MYLNLSIIQDRAKSAILENMLQWIVSFPSLGKPQEKKNLIIMQKEKKGKNGLIPLWL
jgi:hypothetical protein